MSELIEEIRCALAMREAGYDVLLGHQASAELLRRYDEMKKALEEIKRATVEGRVCDDVAWFDQIETLHDFCDRIIDSVTRGFR